MTSGKPIDGIAKGVTPSRENCCAQTKAPASHITSTPKGAIAKDNWQELNPRLKTFKGAHIPGYVAAFPVRAINTVTRKHYED